MGINRFEDLESWKKARALMNLIYDLTTPPLFEEDWELRRHMRRTSVSVMANIAEGFDADSKREFIRFLRISKRSAGELQSHGYASLDRKFISAPQFDKLYAQSKEVKKLIAGMIRYLRRDPGPPPSHS